MTCIKCNGDVCVMQNVNVESTNQVLRRRKCLECGFIFHTAEFMVEYTGKVREDWNKQVSINKKRRLYKNYKRKGENL